jgi:hypothetical protein
MSISQKWACESVGSGSIVDERASPEQRDAILRIMSGQDTEPGATFFQIYFSMLENVDVEVNPGEYSRSHPMPRRK